MKDSFCLLAVVSMMAIGTISIRAQELPDEQAATQAQEIRLSASAPSESFSQSNVVQTLYQPVGDRVDSIRVYEDRHVSIYRDTILTLRDAVDSVAQLREVLLPADSSNYRGHYIQAYIGGAYGTLGYPLSHGGELIGSLSALLQLNYAYFFHPNVGISMGAQFTNYTANAYLHGDRNWLGVTDTDGEKYDHTATIHRWQERQTIHAVAIPVGLQFQTHPASGSGAGFFAGFGASAILPVMRDYNVREADVEHTGYYDSWHLDLNQLHEFQSAGKQTKGKLTTAPSVGVYADLGMLFPVSRQIDLVLSLYGSYALLDMNKSDKRELGWRDDNANFTFMQPYDGVYATTEAGASHPWQAGLKIGLHWRHIPKPTRNTETYFDYIERIDTTRSLVARYDTVVTTHADTVRGFVQPKPAPAAKHVARMVEEFNKIYFDFDKAVLRPDAKQNLQGIAEVLKQHPGRIAIAGHACKTGPRYYNLYLSRRRAQAVADYLVKLGVEKERIEVRGYGFDQPSTDTTHSLSQDRRVEVRLIEE